MRRDPQAQRVRRRGEGTRERGLSRIGATRFIGALAQHRRRGVDKGNPGTASHRDSGGISSGPQRVLRANSSGCYGSWSPWTESPMRNPYLQYRVNQRRIQESNTTYTNQFRTRRRVPPVFRRNASVGNLLTVFSILWVAPHRIYCSRGVGLRHLGDGNELGECFLWGWDSRRWRGRLPGSSLFAPR